MKIGNLTYPELRRRLRDEGVCFQTGPFVIRLQTRISALSKSFQLLYADFPLISEEKFADHRVRLVRARGYRRWIRPKVYFEHDGVRPFHPFPLRLALPLMEWGLNWCVATQAHEYLMIHAAVLERHGKALIIAARQGFGKSTLCAALAWRGWRLLTDELALIALSDNRITPLPRPISLKGNSIDIMRHFAPAAVLGPECPDTTKGTMAHVRPPAGTVERAEEKPLPAWIVFVNYQVGLQARLESVPKARAFLGMADNAFNYNILGAAGFEALARVIDACDCYDFSYSDLQEAIQVFDSL